MSASDRAEFERWRAADPRHARAYARHEQTWKNFDRPIAAGKAEAMIEALAASKCKRQRRNVQGLVAGLSLCVLVGLLWYHNENDIHPITSDAFLAANASVILPVKRTLPDGSIIELKTGAVIGVNFDTNARHVTLERGQVFFQVAKNPLPFVVSANGVGVRAVGTAFSVQVGADAIEVLVTDGTVAVGSTHLTGDNEQTLEGDTPTKDPGRRELESETTGRSAARTRSPRVFHSGLRPFQSPESILVTAGNQMSIDVGGPAIVVGPVAPAEIAQRLAWRKTWLEFTDTPLVAAIDLFNRHSGDGESTRLIIDRGDMALARMEVSGYFSADNVDAFVHLIEQTLGIKADRETERIILRRAR